MKINYFKECSFGSACLLFLCLSSCQHENMLDKDFRTPVLEQLIHQISINQYVELDPVKHDAFLGKQLGVPTSKYTDTYRDASVPDTIYSFSEIPLIRETRSKLIVFEDGSNESYFEDLTPTGVNPLHLLSDTPPKDEFLLSKTIIKDGFIKVINKKGELLVNECFPENNLREFVDTLIYYAVKTLDSPGRIEKPLFSSESQRIQLVQNDRVILEQALGFDKEYTSNLAKVHENLSAVVEMDDLMTRTLKFDLFSSDQLIYRVNYEYDDDTKLVNYLGTKTVSANPRCIEAQSLHVNKSGRPYIYQSRTVFYQNQLILSYPENQL